MGQLVTLKTSNERPLSKKELSEEIGYSTRWIEMMMREGLPYRKPGNGRGARVQFFLSEVDAWMMRRSA